MKSFVCWRFYYRLVFRASFVTWGLGKYGLGSYISVYLAPERPTCRRFLISSLRNSSSKSKPKPISPLGLRKRPEPDGLHQGLLLLRLFLQGFHKGWGVLRGLQVVRRIFTGVLCCFLRLEAFPFQGLGLRVSGFRHPALRG